MAEFARIWRDMPKIVFSRTLERADWNTTIVRDVAVEEITALKAQPGGDLVLGGADLAAAFMQHGLIDGNVEYQDAVRLVQRLMELGKDFEFVTYPVDQHGWQTRWARRDSQRRLVRLWEETILKAGVIGN